MPVIPDSPLKTSFRRLKHRLNPTRESGRMARNSVWLLIDKILRGGGGLAVLIMLGRLLGVDSYGEYGIALAIIGIFTAMATLGLDGVVVRRLVEAPDSSEQVLGTALRLRLTGGSVSALLAALTAYLLFEGDALLPLVAWMGGGLVFQSADVLDYWFQARLQAGPVVRIRILTFLAGAAAKILLILNHAPLAALGAVVFFEMLATALGLLWQGRRHGTLTPWHWSWNRQEMRIQLTLSWPLLVSGLLVSLFFKLDQVILGWLKGNRDVGIYHSGLRLVEIWNFLPMIILPSVYPGLIRLRHHDIEGYHQRLRRLFSLFSLASWLIMAFNLLLAGGLVQFIFGQGFSGGGSVLAILAVTLHFHFSSSIRAQAMLIEGLTLYHTPIALGSIVLMATLDMLLIPPLGPMGAAIASCLSACVSGLISSFFFPRLRHLGWMQLYAIFGGFLCLRRNRT